MGKTWLVYFYKIFLFCSSIDILLGTCHYQTATDYYTTIENFYKSFNMPDIRSMTNPTAATIKTAFLTLNPKLFSSAIHVSMNAENRLREIKICYDLNHQLVSCNNK